MMGRREERERGFVKYLEGLAGWRGDDEDPGEPDRAALAALRRALGKTPAEAATAHRYVAGWLDERGDPWEERCLYVVASLFAFHPEGSWVPVAGQVSDWERNLGASFGRLAPPRADGREAVERRFQWLLASDRHELPDRLRQSISLLKSKDVPVDWLRLLRDLRHWDADEGRVQMRWAGAFWRDAGEDATDEEDAETAEDSIEEENDNDEE